MLVCSFPSLIMPFPSCTLPPFPLLCRVINIYPSQRLSVKGQFVVQGCEILAPPPTPPPPSHFRIPYFLLSPNPSFFSPPFFQREIWLTPSPPIQQPELLVCKQGLFRSFCLITSLPFILITPFYIPQVLGNSCFFSVSVLNSPFELWCHSPLSLIQNGGYLNQPLSLTVWVLSCFYLIFLSKNSFFPVSSP